MGLQLVFILLHIRLLLPFMSLCNTRQPDRLRAISLIVQLSKKERLKQSLSLLGRTLLSDTLMETDVCAMSVRQITIIASIPIASTSLVSSQDCFVSQRSGVSVMA